MAVLEAGMKSGRSSVSLHIVLPDGTEVYVTTSAALFYSMAHVLQGAEMRFKDNPIG